MDEQGQQQAGLSLECSSEVLGKRSRSSALGRMGTMAPRAQGMLMTAKCSDGSSTALGSNGEQGYTQERVMILVTSLILAINCPRGAVPWGLGGTDGGVSTGVALETAVLGEGRLLNKRDGLRNPSRGIRELIIKYRI